MASLHPDTFDRVLVGVDGTDYGAEALTQALVLARPDSAIRAVTALDLFGVAQTGWDATRFAETLSEKAAEVHGWAEQALSGRSDGLAKLVKGQAQAVLRDEIRAFEPTLLALGGRNRSRFLGALLGETASMLIHDAAYSVLLARPHWGETWRPDRIVVGVDGSPHALAALAVADDLAARLGSAVAVVSARGGKAIQEDASWADRVTEWSPASAHNALRDRSATADLVVIGSRGAHGVKALGSVSERIAHRARCSVLIVHLA